MINISGAVIKTNKTIKLHSGDILTHCEIMSSADPVILAKGKNIIVTYCVIRMYHPDNPNFNLA